MPALTEWSDQSESTLLDTLSLDGDPLDPVLNAWIVGGCSHWHRVSYDATYFSMC